MEYNRVAKVVCMQCGITIRDFRIEGGSISHGLCGPCAHDYAKEIDRIAAAMHEEKLIRTAVS